MPAWRRADRTRDRTGPVDRFHRLCVAAVARLPFGLNSVVAPTFLGFVLINSFTFGFDLVLLTHCTPVRRPACRSR